MLALYEKSLFLYYSKKYDVYLILSRYTAPSCKGIIDTKYFFRTIYYKPESSWILSLNTNLEHASLTDSADDHSTSHDRINEASASPID